MTVSSSGKSADELIQMIAQRVVDDPKYVGRDWAGISVVSILGDGVRQLSGYSFDSAGESQPGTPTGKGISDLFVELQNATLIDGKSPWVSALLKIKRDGMRFGVDFEYENPMRWKINPASMAEAIKSLKP